MRPELCLVVVAWISRIFIELEIQVLLTNFATISVACLFDHPGGYPLVYYFYVSLRYDTAYFAILTPQLQTPITWRCHQARPNLMTKS